MLKALTPHEADLLDDALPEIIALVDAAERAKSQEQPFLTVAGYVYPLREALDNLASKLSGERQSPTDIAGAGQEGCG